MDFIENLIDWIDTVDTIDCISMIILTFYTHSDRMTGKGSFITIYLIYPFLGFPKRRVSRNRPVTCHADTHISTLDFIQ